jgi:hypothetical protein
MSVCRAGELMSVVRDSEVFFRFVTPHGEGTARNISEWHNTV